VAHRGDECPQAIHICHSVSLSSQPDGFSCDLVSLPDLVRAKKTQRDEDWPMIRRLVEAHYFEHRPGRSQAQVRFWLRELRTPELLIEVARGHTALARRVARQRPLLRHAVAGRTGPLERALATEEALERDRDRRYWRPLRRELERLRHERSTGSPGTSPGHRAGGR
jgi:hypothetical protein